MSHLEDNQMIHGCPEASTEVTFTQKNSKFWPFLKKNAFVSLTMIAVAAGKRNVKMSFNLTCFAHRLLYIRQVFISCAIRVSTLTF